MTDVRSALGVISAALATFLVVLAVLTARISTGHDPALAGSSAALAQALRGARATVRTSASGRVLGGQSGLPAGETAQAPASPLVTRSSGAPGTSGGADD
jgi:hypothetical protein